MEADDKHRLLEEFGRYLDTLETVETPEADSTDLFSLFSELASLRTEVRGESRLFRTALDQLQQAQDQLRDSAEQRNAELQRLRSEAATLRRSALRPVLLELLELRDRIAAGLAALEGYRPVSGWFRIRSRREDRRFIASIREGQAITARRLEEILLRLKVRPMAVLGEPVNPQTMNVVAVEQRPDLASGIVTEEFRKGFLWHDEILRLAEVKANKL